MKKIMMTLCAAFFALAMSAQSSQELRSHLTPKVERLMQYCENYNKGRVIDRDPYTYQNNWKHEIEARVGITSVPFVSASSNNPKIDSVNRARFNAFTALQDSIRKTFMELSKESKESYMWEYHNDGVDTIRYTIALGEYPNDSNKQAGSRIRQLDSQEVPEFLSYQYTKAKNMPFGYGHLFYKYSPDSIYSKVQYIDREKYDKILQGIFSQKGFSKRDIYIYNDYDHPYDDSEVLIGSHWRSPAQPYIETKVTVYTTKSEELALSSLQSLVDQTFQFVDEYPSMQYVFRPHKDFMRYGRFYPSEVFRSEKYSRLHKEYGVYIQYLMNNKEFCFLVLDTTGNMMLPKEWIKLKSWKNGKKTYDKTRKSVLPERLSENLVSIGDYEVLDDDE